MWEWMKVKNWTAGLQWLFFLFTNTVVIPITIGSAFQLEQGKIIALLQLSFLFTGIACIIQALFGHRRSIMEGQSGLWWGVILSMCYIAPAQGLPLAVLGGSISAGIIISGMITMLVGLTGLSKFIARWFNAGVMAVFTFLLAIRLNTIFLKGMLGIPFSAEKAPAQIDIPIFLLSCMVVLLTIFLSVKGRNSISQYSLLIGIIAGWIAYEGIFKSVGEAVNMSGEPAVGMFLLGELSFDIGIIITAVVAGMLNLSNTFGALKGTDELYKSETTNWQYRRSFTISGVFTIISGLFGMVPYAPYVSSIGFLNQTRILERLPFILGGVMFIVMGVIPDIGNLMVKMPLSVGSAALLVAYMRLLQSALGYFAQIEMTEANLYRVAAPLFIGIIFMAFPAEYFVSVPASIRPLVSNGLLIGILLALVLENTHFGNYQGK
ncbi:uracil/xanthine transporter [Bacillus sp. V2I10]|uniref:uracil/xanthine transporter n=1 Tax=Bacillus sp. V2I10 TaxID=3042276 RepID=UPI002782FF18|nr:uracil/xanthine transporter [Bacillus sp. V2I10]MDQ0859677.1 xanthine/uracil permease [Bacillus sp. V2I10]